VQSSRAEYRRGRDRRQLGTSTVHALHGRLSLGSLRVSLTVALRGFRRCALLRALLADPQAELYGVEIGEAAGLPSGTVHPILARLEGLRWGQSRWVDIDPKVEACPARRYYRLTATGAQAARTALGEAYQSKSTRRMRIPRPVAEPS
jgi:PadR family transcriptional regulator, regulatory protein PadR